MAAKQNLLHQIGEVQAELVRLAAKAHALEKDALPNDAQTTDAEENAAIVEANNKADALGAKNGLPPPVLPKPAVLPAGQAGPPAPTPIQPDNVPKTPTATPYDTTRQAR